MKIDKNGNFELKTGNEQFFDNIKENFNTFESNTNEINSLHYPHIAEKGHQAVYDYISKKGKFMDALLMIGQAVDFNDKVHEHICCFGADQDIHGLFISLFERNPELIGIVMSAIKYHNDAER